MMKRKDAFILRVWRGLLLSLALLLVPPAAGAQTKSAIDGVLRTYFRDYQPDGCRIGRCKLVGTELNTAARSLTIHASAAFGEQPFRPETTEQIYRDLRALLPAPASRYRLTVCVDGVAIDDLVPTRFRRKRMPERVWTKAEDARTTVPWVTNASRPYDISEGLQGRHLAINASHGLYYRLDERQWDWQRPALFCTREDLLTQSIVFPYLIPMLENAGAVVFTARERDSQPNEIIIDNDGCPDGQGIYVEEHGAGSAWSDTAPGFLTPLAPLADHVNPFVGGTARYVQTARGRRGGSAAALWMPQIPAAGRYAVYVAYTSCPASVTDAHYVVVHKGGASHFTVNQQMGGGTWVCLGTFDFDAGATTAGMVALTNESAHDGVVSADAVRFGGGMGSVARGVVADSLVTSGMPRYLEGARYWTHYAGFPYEVYGNKNSQHDYNEDINARSLAANVLMGGSAYLPDSVGRGVPLELSFALHTDAGVEPEGIVGTLGICTTNHNDGRLGNGRLSRFASRDMVDEVMTSVVADIRRAHPADTVWARRGIWDRNYSESRVACCPSMILELLAHQNFGDMLRAHDPHFKFLAARAIYKGLLRYVATMHGDAYTVQPLPPDHLMLVPDGPGRRFRLSWEAVTDTLESSARPTGYVVYTREGNGDFDDGRYVRANHLSVELEPDRLYSFRVTAVNKGGQSFPSETLAAGSALESRGSVLVVNGFQRLSGPAVVSTPDSIGFDLLRDPGVPYISTTAFCGYQHDWNPASMALGSAGSTVGASGDELLGQTLCGNTFDFAAVHGAAILAAGYTFASVSRACFEEGLVNPASYKVVDLYTGLQDTDVLSGPMQQRLSAYVLSGGSLLVSGSHLGCSALADTPSRTFLTNLLRCRYVADNRSDADASVSGQGQTLALPRTWNPRIYPVVSPEVLAPVSPSADNFVLYAYGSSRQPAAVATSNPTYRTAVLGFPFEAAGDDATRTAAMSTLLQWLTTR